MGTNPKRLVPFQLVPFQLVLKQVGSNKLERHLFDPEPNGASEIWFGVEQIVFRLEPNESTFRPLNGSRPDESIRSALDYGDLSETFACAFGQSSAVPTIWAKCFALTTQKFKKVADRHSLARQVGTALVPAEIVPDDHAALHHKAHALHFGDVRERISRNSDDVGEFAFLDAADLLLDAVIQHVGGVHIRGLQGLHRFQSPLRVIGELVGLLAVWDFG